MSKGKTAVQAAHASVTAFMVARIKVPEIADRWFNQGQKKVALRAESLDELLSLKEKAEKVNLPVALIRDMGLTELEPGTITALGIGPERNEKIDLVTGHLKLL